MTLNSLKKVQLAGKLEKIIYNSMIYIIEPQCYEVEHSLGNAAFLHLLKELYPSDKIIFYADKSHLNVVRNITLLNDIEYVEIKIPQKGLGNIKRFKSEFTLAQKILRNARNNEVNKILFTSFTTPGLVSLKFLLLFYYKTKVSLVPHSILENLYKRKFNNINDYVFNFNFWFKNFNTNRVQYLILGKSIEVNLFNIVPHISKYTSCFDLPYLYSNSNNVEINNVNKIFGYLGSLSTYKGGESFLKLANNHYNNLVYKPKFQVIGRVLSESLNKSIGDNVQIISPTIDLTRTEFDLHLSKIDYCVFCFSSSSYKLRASGTIFDSISYLKPIISLRNDFFEYYFNKFGDIGYLCESIKEMEQVIYLILNGKQEQRYLLQVENLKNARKYLNIQNISKRVKSIF